VIQVFKSELIKQQLTPEELSDLADDFHQYKKTSTPANYFGRDVPYNDQLTPPLIRQEEVAHLHLVNPVHGRRSCPQFNRTSDNHLVYCQGFFNREQYLLMLILKPNAHEQARNHNTMYKLAKMASNFREKY
jgi:mRNA interferase YafO